MTPFPRTKEKGKDGKYNFSIKGSLKKEPEKRFLGLFRNQGTEGHGRKGAAPQKKKNVKNTKKGGGGVSASSNRHKHDPIQEGGEWAATTKEVQARGPGLSRDNYHIPGGNIKGGKWNRGGRVRGGSQIPPDWQRPTWL